MMTIANFKTFTLADMKAVPSDNYFNTKNPNMKVIGVRIDNNVTYRPLFSILPSIFKEIEAADTMDIRVALTMDEIRNLVVNGKMLVNDKLASRKDKVQRCYVMPQQKASQLILSLINGDNTMPDIDVVITKEGGNLVLYINDGLQRTQTICKFLNNELRICGTNTKLDGCYFSDIPDDIKEIILNRIVHAKVNHPCTIVYRSKTFETLNTSATKMAAGETLNAKHGDKKAFEVAIERIVNSQEIRKVFCGISKKKAEDVRMQGVSDLLYAVSSYYLIENDAGIGSCNGKEEIISTFMNLKKVVDFDCEVEALFNSVYNVCCNINTYFGAEFCHRMKHSMLAPANDHFVPDYMPVMRTDAINTTIATVMFYVTMKLSDTFKTMKKSDIQILATELDKTFADIAFRHNYMKSVCGHTVKARNEYVWNEVVCKVLDELGVAIIM